MNEKALWTVSHLTEAGPSSSSLIYTENCRPHQGFEPQQDDTVQKPPATTRRLRAGHADDDADHWSEIGEKLPARNNRSIVSVQTTPVDGAGVTFGDGGESIAAILLRDRLLTMSALQEAQLEGSWKL